MGVESVSCPKAARLIMSCLSGVGKLCAIEKAPLI
jgi:hypothetical protein